MFSSPIYAVRQNTPASELVAASGNADALCRERRAAENVSVKDFVSFPPLQVFLTDNLEKNEIRRRSKSICFAYVILKWFLYNQQRVFVRKLGRTARTICVFKSHLCRPLRKPITRGISRVCWSLSRKFCIGRRKRKTINVNTCWNVGKNGSGHSAAQGLAL